MTMAAQHMSEPCWPTEAEPNGGRRGRARFPDPCPAWGRPVSANDVDARSGMWRRFGGDDWAAFDALPEPVRRRMHQHSYDPWAVNTLMLWRRFRRKHASSGRAVVTLHRYLDECERLERDAFATAHRRRYGTALPHVAAGASVLRYGPAAARNLARTRRSHLPCPPTVPREWANRECRARRQLLPQL